jgi:hypothetical protein
VAGRSWATEAPPELGEIGRRRGQAAGEVRKGGEGGRGGRGQTTRQQGRRRPRAGLKAAVVGRERRDVKSWRRTTREEDNRRGEEDKEVVGPTWDFLWAAGRGSRVDADGRTLSA